MDRNYFLIVFIVYIYLLLYYECQTIPRKYPLYNVFGVIVYNVTCVTNDHRYVLFVDTNRRNAKPFFPREL